MYRVFLFCLLGILSFQLSGQFTDHNGSLYTREGDTLIGTIHINGFRPGARECLFSEPGNSLTRVFLPEQLLGFQIPEIGLFVSKHVKINGKQELLFVEYLVKGQVSLYYLRADSRDLYFFENDSIFIELDNEEKIKTTQSGASFSSKSKRYIGQLKYGMQDAQELHKEIENASFDAKSLVNLINNYHDLVCDDGQCIIYWKEPRSQKTLRLSSGGYVSSFHLKESAGSIKDHSWTIGFELEFQSAFISKNASFTTGLIISQPSFTGSLNTDFYYDVPYELFLDINYTLVKLPLIFNYAFGQGALRPKVFFGLSANIAMNPENFGEVRFNNGTSEVNFNSSNFHLGYLAGGTIEYRFTNRYGIQLSAYYEKQKQVVNLAQLFDYHYYNSIYFNVGFSYYIAH